jgi:tryptophanyl-tRNA synthetase
MKQKGFGENVPAGFLVYPVSQAADILFCDGNTVPVGEDQLPVLEQVNEIVFKFNAIYGETFKKVEPIISTTPRLVGIDGNAKASKSLGNAIYLADTKDEIERKVMMMYTDPEHIHVNDPGKVSGNVVFAYLDIFDPNKEEVAKLKQQYKKGGLGDIAIKKRLVGILEEIIGPIRMRRQELAKDPERVFKILREGTERTRAVAKETMKRVKKGIKIDYFD